MAASATQQYILDTNILRPFFNCYYPPDLFPEIWNGFNKLDEHKLLTSVEGVKTECERQLKPIPNTSDGLNWIHNHSDIFTQPTKKELEIITEITSHAEFQLTTKELTGEKTLADLQLVAKGVVINGIVVTDERYQPTGRKIPTICERYKVQCISRIEFIRALRKISDDKI